MSHQAYGPRVGVPRILDLLAEHAIEATFFVPGVTATLPHAGLSSTSLRPPHPLPSTGKLTCGDLRAAIYCPPLDSTVMIRPRSKAR
jgi:hypothetical protein